MNVNSVLNIIGGLLVSMSVSIGGGHLVGEDVVVPDGQTKIMSVSDAWVSVNIISPDGVVVTDSETVGAVAEPAPVVVEYEPVEEEVDAGGSSDDWVDDTYEDDSYDDGGSVSSGSGSGGNSSTTVVNSIPTLPFAPTCEADPQTACQSEIDSNTAVAGRWSGAWGETWIYMTHNYNGYGDLILNLQPGDTVVISGGAMAGTFRVTGESIYNKYSQFIPAEFPTYTLQTCYWTGDNVRMVHLERI